MGAPMFVPVPFVLWTVGTALALLCLFLGMKAVAGGWRWAPRWR